MENTYYSKLYILTLNVYYSLLEEAKKFGCGIIRRVELFNDYQEYFARLTLKRVFVEKVFSII